MVSSILFNTIYLCKLKYKKINIKHLPFTLHIFIDANAKDVVNKLNRIKNKIERFEAKDYEMSEFAVASTFDLEYSLPGHYAVNYKHTDLNTIAHEVFHIVMWHNKYIGQKYSHNSEESFAYLFGFLISEIYEFTKGSNKLDKG